MSQGIGYLTAKTGADTLARWVVQEGTRLDADLFGSFTFTLERAPLPSEFDVRQMSTIDLADLLARRLREEALEREDEAADDHWEEP